MLDISTMHFVEVNLLYILVYCVIVTYFYKICTSKRHTKQKYFNSKQSQNLAKIKSRIIFLGQFKNGLRY